MKPTAAFPGPFRRPAKAMLVVGPLLIVAGLLFLFLGNPQWHRWIYQSQLHMWCWDSSRVLVDSNGERHLLPPKGYSGRWTQWYGNGHRRSEFTCVNGRYEGEFSRWNPDGSLDATGAFRNNQYDGEVTSWSYSPDGPLSSRVTTWKDGKPISWHCCNYWYHENGRKAGVARMAEGKRNGLEQTWDENGQLTEETTYRDDRLHGRRTVYCEDGRKMRDELYENGEPVGVWSFWDKDGTMSREPQGFRPVLPSDVIHPPQEEETGNMPGGDKPSTEDTF